MIKAARESWRRVAYNAVRHDRCLDVSGHVFITQGDLTRLACDAWLLPTDAGLAIEQSWREGIPSELTRHGRLAVERPEGWGASVLSAPVPGHDHDHSLPWMTSIGMLPPVVEVYLRGVREFVHKATDVAKRQGPAFERSKPLLALPVVGTGAGGASRVKGDVHLSLLPELYDLAASEDVDLALVTHDAAAFSAAQAVRRRLDTDRTQNAFPELSDELRSHALELGALAAQGQLVLFLGAGVGVGAGLPLWKGLIRELATQAHGSEHDTDGLDGLPIVDQARILERRLGNLDIRAAIERLLSVRRHSLSHSLLAALPVNEIVTTNYDTLFEMACQGVNRDLAILPYQPSAAKRRWLLKLHGSIGQGDIVLTRDDYLHLAHLRGALAGIVQALLVTRHLLFVGYSLSDDDFHQIVYDVRTAVHGAQATELHYAFGTALLPWDDPVLTELWEPDISCVGVSPTTTPLPEAGRRVEVLLDAIVAGATTQTRYLLNPSYNSVLSVSDRELRGYLEELRSRVSSLPKTAATTFVEQFLASLSE